MIAGGIHHSLVIDPDGNVWASGLNCYGQLGIGHTRNQLQFTQVLGLPPVVKVAAARHGHHSILLDDQGEIWVCGRNDYSQLGVDAEIDPMIVFPYKLSNLPCIIMITCGGDYSIILDSNGSIWGTGKNDYGQLSCRDENVKGFTLINTTEIGIIAKVSCGSAHTLVLSESGVLFGTGYNYNGELALGHYNHSARFYKCEEIEASVQDICCANSHTLVLDDTGGVWSTGYNQYGQLGLNNMTNRNLLTKIQNVPPMRHILCAGYSSISIDDDGKVFAWGWNEMGQLGLSHRDNVLTPVEVPDTPEIDHGCMGSDHTLLADMEGSLWVAGSNKNGQLGSAERVPPLGFLKIEGITVNNGRIRKTKRAVQTPIHSAHDSQPVIPLSSPVLSVEDLALTEQSNVIEPVKKTLTADSLSDSIEPQLTHIPFGNGDAKTNRKRRRDHLLDLIPHRFVSSKKKKSN